MYTCVDTCACGAEVRRDKYFGWSTCMEGMTTEEVCVLYPGCGICHWESHHDSASLGSPECNETTTCVFVFPGSGFDCGLYVCL